MKLPSRALLGIILGSLAISAHADLAVVVAAKSAVGNLSKQQVSDLFLGKVATFPDGSQAVPVEMAESAPQREEFHGKVTGKTPAQLKAYWSKQMFSGTGIPPKEVPGTGDVKKLVSSNPNMIGYVDKDAVDASLKVIFAP